VRFESPKTVTISVKITQSLQNGSGPVVNVDRNASHDGLCETYSNILLAELGTRFNDTSKCLRRITQNPHHLRTYTCRVCQLVANIVSSCEYVLGLTSPPYELSLHDKPSWSLREKEMLHFEQSRQGWRYMSKGPHVLLLHN
jgi:hypothetical protein